MNATESLIVCPPWCQTDHESELTEVITHEHNSCRYYDENYDRLPELFGRPLNPGGRKPGDPVTIDYAPIHRRLVGTMPVRVGADEEIALLEVVVDRVDDLPTRTLVLEPSGWTEDYSAQEARELARLLVAAAEVIEQ